MQVLIGAPPYNRLLKRQQLDNLHILNMCIASELPRKMGNNPIKNWDPARKRKRDLDSFHMSIMVIR
jgi:hypothetical protein